jgi:hypothetical protein
MHYIHAINLASVVYQRSWKMPGTTVVVVAVQHREKGSIRVNPISKNNTRVFRTKPRNRRSSWSRHKPKNKPTMMLIIIKPITIWKRDGSRRRRNRRMGMASTTRRRKNHLEHTRVHTRRMKMITSTTMNQWLVAATISTTRTINQWLFVAGVRAGAAAVAAGVADAVGADNKLSPLVARPRPDPTISVHRLAVLDENHLVARKRTHIQYVNVYAWVGCVRARLAVSTSSCF